MSKEHQSGSEAYGNGGGTHTLTKLWEEQVVSNKTFHVHKHDIWLLGMSLLLGILFDYLFYNKAIGISLIIAVFALYSVFLWRMNDQINLKDKTALILFILIGLLCLSYVMYSNQLFHALNIIVIPLLIAAHTLLLMRQRREAWYKVVFIGQMLKQVLPVSIRYFPVPFRLINAILQPKIKHQRYKNIVKIGLGFLLSLPILLVVITLLASADKVFEELISSLPNFWQGLNVGELFFRLLSVFVIAMYIFSYIWGLSRQSDGTDRVNVAEPGVSRKKRPLDGIVILTMLGMINSVYIVFVLAQFTYLFGNGAGVLPDGTTYADYARNGFGELVIVTLINFTILSIVIHATFKEGSRAILLAKKVMLTLLISSSFVMLFSSFVRLVLYEQAYGFTVTRILVHAFLIYLFVILIFALYRIWREHNLLLKQYIIISLIAYIVINFINIDRIIVIQNIARYEQTGKIDIAYLGKLSFDVVPELVKLNEQMNKPDQLDELLQQFKHDLNVTEPWPSFNISKYRARMTLE